MDTIGATYCAGDGLARALPLPYAAPEGPVGIGVEPLPMAPGEDTSAGGVVNPVARPVVNPLRAEKYPLGLRFGPSALGVVMPSRFAAPCKAASAPEVEPEAPLVMRKR